MPPPWPCMSAAWVAFVRSSASIALRFVQHENGEHHFLQVPILYRILTKAIFLMLPFRIPFQTLSPIRGDISVIIPVSFLRINLVTFSHLLFLYRRFCLFNPRFRFKIVSSTLAGDRHSSPNDELHVINDSSNELSSWMSLPEGEAMLRSALAVAEAPRRVSAVFGTSKWTLRSGFLGWNGSFSTSASVGSAAWFVLAVPRRN